MLHKLCHQVLRKEPYFMDDNVEHYSSLRGELHTLCSESERAEVPKLKSNRPVTRGGLGREDVEDVGLSWLS